MQYEDWSVLAADSRQDLARRHLLRIDPAVRGRECFVSYVSVYAFDRRLNKWRPSSVEGGLHVVYRETMPQYKIIVPNQKGEDNFSIGIDENTEVSGKPGNVFLRVPSRTGDAEKDIWGIWMYHAGDRDALINSVTSIVRRCRGTADGQDSARSGETEARRDAESTNLIDSQKPHKLMAMDGLGSALLGSLQGTIGRGEPGHQQCMNQRQPVNSMKIDSHGKGQPESWDGPDGRDLPPPSDVMDQNHTAQMADTKRDSLSQDDPDPAMYHDTRYLQNNARQTNNQRTTQNYDQQKPIDRPDDRDGQYYDWQQNRGYNDVNQKLSYVQSRGMNDNISTSRRDEPRVMDRQWGKNNLQKRPTNQQTRTKRYDNEVIEEKSQVFCDGQCSGPCDICGGMNFTGDNENIPSLTNGVQRGFDKQVINGPLRGDGGYNNVRPITRDAPRDTNGPWGDNIISHIDQKEPYPEDEIYFTQSDYEVTRNDIRNALVHMVSTDTFLNGFMAKLRLRKDTQAPNNSINHPNNKIRIGMA